MTKYVKFKLDDFYQNMSATKKQPNILKKKRIPECLNRRKMSRSEKVDPAFVRCRNVMMAKGASVFIASRLGDPGSADSGWRSLPLSLDECRPDRRAEKYAIIFQRISRVNR